MKVNARKPKVQVILPSGAFRLGEVNFTTITGEYNVTLDGETEALQVPSEQVRYLLDIEGFIPIKRVA